ncbi:peptidoglycan recognition protein family protein [Gordonia sp. NPDC003376]
MGATRWPHRDRRARRDPWASGVSALGVYRGAPTARSGAGSNPSAPTRQVIVLHSTEGGYEGAISWMISEQNGSYHLIRALGGQGARLVADSRQAWAAMSAGNRIGLHICIEGYARYSRGEWTSKGGSGLEGLAHDIAGWAKTYGVPLVRISPADVRAGRRGICTHADISAAFGESDHTDPGSGFPLDLVIARAVELNTGGNTMALTPAEDCKAQLTGSAEAGKYPGWPQLGGRTVVDALAAIGAKLGIEGFRDPKAGK